MSQFLKRSLLLVVVKVVTDIADPSPCTVNTDYIVMFSGASVENIILALIRYDGCKQEQDER